LYINIGVVYITGQILQLPHNTTYTNVDMYTCKYMNYIYKYKSHVLTRFRRFATGSFS